MNLYTSLTFRYLKENKKRTIVTIIGIILSTALICGIGNIYKLYKATGIFMPHSMMLKRRI